MADVLESVATSVSHAVGTSAADEFVAKYNDWFHLSFVGLQSDASFLDWMDALNASLPLVFGDDPTMVVEARGALAEVMRRHGIDERLRSWCVDHPGDCD